MGYYSTMEYCDFRSSLSLKEIIERLNGTKFKDMSGNECNLSDYYEIAEIELPENDYGRFEVVGPGGEHYGKHYYDGDLAMFISRLIAPDEWTTLEFVGEDGARWGYLIFHTNPADCAGEKWNIKPIEYKAAVEGMDIEEYAGKYLAERAAESK